MTELEVISSKLDLLIEMVQEVRRELRRQEKRQSLSLTGHDEDVGPPERRGGDG